jgi:16S rRNA (cytosine967-C5)-methyltransferase
VNELTARKFALKILKRVDQGAYVDKILESHLSQSGLSDTDKTLVKKLVLGVTKWRERLDWILKSYLTRGPEKLNPWIKNVLRLGVYQIIFLDRIPPWAVVDEAVKLAEQYGNRGTKGLINAVLRRVVREGDNVDYPDIETDPAAYLSVYYSHPLWVVKRWIKRYGSTVTAELCRFDNTQPKIFIRVNSLRTTPEKLIRELKTKGIKARPNQLLPDFLELESAEGLFKTRCFLEGHFQVQDPGAGVAVLLLAPRLGERVLDMCSAPGGKATQIAEIMKNQGLILALDRHKGRLRMFRENIKRLGIQIIQAKAEDALNFTSEPFDRVLVDVPCSGSGTLCRRADARWKMQEKIEELTALQLALLERGARLLKPRGVLVYSTCSIEPEENEMVVEGFIKENPQFKLEKATFVLPSIADDYVEIFPPRDHCDGSFAARIRRVEDG